MVFNSFEFALFFPIVFAVYWLAGLRTQNAWLLIASYVFYGSWDWRFLSLILISTVVDYFVGQKIYERVENEDKQKARRWLLLSLVTNLGILAVFKYYDFFLGSLVALLGAVGIEPAVSTLNIILPVGISFYTFQTLSYSIDIYRGQLKPIRSPLVFAVFVAYFPQLVAGPIERARRLLPQLSQERNFRLADLIGGGRLVIIGLFKKVFVADNLAPYVDQIFSSGSYTTADVMFAGLLFAFQIYADFSGYTDIARGISRMLGIELRLNFDYPYVSSSPQEFWRRWHISLSTWLRDYLYIPLGGNKGGQAATYRNLSLTMLLGGLWHGAAWNFVMWGGYQGLLLAVHRWISRRRPAKPAVEGRDWSLIRVLKVAFFFQFVCYGWILFRAESGAQIAEMTRSLFDFSFSSQLAYGLAVLQFIIPLCLFEAFWAVSRTKLDANRVTTAAINGIVFGVLIYCIAFLGGASDAFIYFQF